MQQSRNSSHKKAHSASKSSSGYVTLLTASPMVTHTQFYKELCYFWSFSLCGKMQIVSISIFRTFVRFLFHLNSALYTQGLH